MANRRRVLRLQQLIMESAATHIQRELGDPRIGLVSITRVKLAPDLTQCQIFWSLLGDQNAVRTCERGLERALPSIQRAVAAALQTRTTPRLILRHDDSLANAEKLETIFTQLREERGEDLAGDSPDGDEPEGEIAEEGQDASSDGPKADSATDAPE